MTIYEITSSLILRRAAMYIPSWVLIVVGILVFIALGSRDHGIAELRQRIEELEERVEELEPEYSEDEDIPFP